MKIINLMVLASAISADALVAGNVWTVEEAAKKGLVKLEIKGKGGYTGDVIEMKIRNVTNAPISLKVEAGRRLDSKDDSQQDILVTQQQSFVLAANQQRSYNVFGMCCQAHNSAPSLNSVYDVGKMADSNLVKLAAFIDKNKYYSNYTAQQAVWVISDNNSIASIEDGNKEDVQNLRKYVSLVTGRPIPAYDVVYRQQDESSVIGRAVKVEGVFAYSLNIDNKVTIAIFNSEGKQVQLLFERQPHSRGDYKLFYTFNTANLPAGTYYAKMITDGAVVKEEKIEF
ncbi:MAG: hypothetical protein JWO44_533 [Bacteroidetes bacterium]|nr:hypothetical protein [Bacteroidota bacterium]